MWCTIESIWLELVSMLATMHTMWPWVISRDNPICGETYMWEVARSPNIPMHLLLLLLSTINDWPQYYWHMLGNYNTILSQHPWRMSRGRFKNIQSPNIRNQVHFLKSSCAYKGTINKILKLKVKNHIDFIQDSHFPRQDPWRTNCLRCPVGPPGLGWIWLGECDMEVICMMFGWCLTIHTKWKAGLQWNVTFFTISFVVSWLLSFATCSLRKYICSVYYSLIRSIDEETWSARYQFLRLHGG